MKIILDSNILVYAAKNKVDLVSQIKDKFGIAEILIPNLVLKELELLTEKAQKGADKRAAKLALQLIKFSKLKIAKLEPGHTDKRILELALKEKAAVGTNDSGLKKKLKEAGEKIKKFFKKDLEQKRELRNKASKKMFKSAENKAMGGRIGYKSGMGVCKIAKKGKGRAYGKNS